MTWKTVFSGVGLAAFACCSSFVELMPSQSYRNTFIVKISWEARGSKRCCWNSSFPLKYRKNMCLHAVKYRVTCDISKLNSFKTLWNWLCFEFFIIFSAAIQNTAESLLTVHETFVGISWFSLFREKKMECFVRSKKYQVFGKFWIIVIFIWKFRFQIKIFCWSVNRFGQPTWNLIKIGFFWCHESGH